MIRKILSPVNQAITHVQDWADEKPVSYTHLTLPTKA